jgi:hypothetical protein
MTEIITGITVSGFIFAFFSFGIGIYMNIWVYYSADKKKFPLFPILNPLSFSSYELMLNSMFKINWEIAGKNQKIKLLSNKLRRFSGIILVLSIISGIVNLILNSL